MKSNANHKNPASAQKTSDKRKDTTDLRFLEMLIKGIIKKLEENSYEPKVQDALKAIQLKQRMAQTSEVERSETHRAEKIFWQLIEEIKKSEFERLNSLQSRAESVEAQILRTIIALKNQVRRGVLPVKTITDTFNQEKSEESQSQDAEFVLTYQRIGRILSAMRFTKAKVKSNSAILWDQENIKRLAEIYGLQQTQERQETLPPR